MSWTGIGKEICGKGPARERIANFMFGNPCCIALSFPCATSCPTFASVNDQRKTRRAFRQVISEARSAGLHVHTSQMGIAEVVFRSKVGAPTGSESKRREIMLNYYTSCKFLACIVV